MPNESIFPLTVYFEDVDMGGIVHHPNYLKYMERARVAWCNNLDICLTQLAADGIYFVVRQALLDYLAPARLNDGLEVVSRIADAGFTYLEYWQQIRQQANKQQIICTGKIKVVCVNQQQKPCRLPARLVEDK